MFFWQASLEAEGRKLRSKAKERRRRPPLPNRLAQGRRFASRSTPHAGMLLSNIIGFFIIVTTAATLHAHGITHIGTAAQAAEALRPLAGPFAFFLFSLGHHRHRAARGAGARGFCRLCRGGKFRLGRQPRIAGARRAGLLSYCRGGDARRTGRGADAARSDPDAVLERGRQRHRRRAADGRA